MGIEVVSAVGELGAGWAMEVVGVVQTLVGWVVGWVDGRMDRRFSPALQRRPTHSLSGLSS